MLRITRLIVLVAIAGPLMACGNNSDVSAEAKAPLVKNLPEVGIKPADDSAIDAKPVGPVQIRYRLVGTPLVGSPLAIELSLTSAVSGEPIALSYRINDVTAMRFPDDQASKLSVTAEANTDVSHQQLTVIPLRQGRLYLNVTATIETASGSMASVTAIPIQVGNAPRQMEENGSLTTDEDGNAIRSLPAKEQ